MTPTSLQIMSDRSPSIDDALSDEARRLAALIGYGILDTPPEQDFDDIVHIAANVCNTPIALVSLVEQDRQWFKARVGIDACETPINQSVCALGLCSSDLLIIPDLTADPRTIDNTLVSGESNLRFYAGAPLITPNGEVIGMLCVIDVVPRPDGLTSEQKMGLQALARQVIAQLELRLAIEAMRKLEAERRLLNEEMSHRLKNTLALVQGMANQTLKGVTERDAVAAFENRLMALSSAHDILLQDNWSSARLHRVVEGGMALHAPLDRFEIDGPEMMLGPRGALSVAMLMHELATNAVKHGALSAPTGHVRVGWRIESGDAPVLHLIWRESGGPAVARPEQGGFGSKLIAMGLCGARKVTETYGTSGYEASFSAPLSRVQEI